jgi:hypothetical protein
MEFAITYILLMLYFVHFPVFNYYNFSISSNAHSTPPPTPKSLSAPALYIIRLYGQPCTSWHLAWRLTQPSVLSSSSTLTLLSTTCGLHTYRGH